MKVIFVRHREFNCHVGNANSVSKTTTTKNKKCLNLDCAERTKLTEHNPHNDEACNVWEHKDEI